jgi:SAM-dependent methyltransferase
MPIKVIGRLKRALTVYQDLGAKALLQRVWRRLARLLGHEDPQLASWTKSKELGDTAFDTVMGTQTGGIQSLFDLQIVGENSRYGLSHIATDPRQFADVMASLDLDFSPFTFIDLGSGKGRALILAAQLPFRRLIGVEFAVELAEAARANISMPAVAKLANSRIELICCDAAAYAFPDDPLIIYLFNPFGAAIVRRIAQNARVSWESNPRPIEIVYMNPVHASEFLAAGWLSINDGPVFARLRPG